MLRGPPRSAAVHGCPRAEAKTRMCRAGNAQGAPTPALTERRTSASGRGSGLRSAPGKDESVGQRGPTKMTGRPRSPGDMVLPPGQLPGAASTSRGGTRVAESLQAPMPTAAARGQLRRGTWRLRRSTHATRTPREPRSWLAIFVGHRNHRFVVYRATAANSLRNWVSYTVVLRGIRIQRTVFDVNPCVLIHTALQLYRM